MYLRRIEVHGFKSFANKIVFQFHDGITGIVGPNGSGKSNVADAVRWVLGEQSAKQLRGSNMQDIIFSGTQTRKPVGFAYVAITLDNSDHKLPIDYEEVTVARRVYRSGESEYLVNGSICRLRDVQDLFLDTGIGKEGYSIIGQGQIDKILSGKPEERRELFDEAAGIVKFKKRKNIAEKDLETERANLSRVTDILSEIEKQIAPLEKQSVVAREYLKLKEGLKNLEINQFLFEYEKNSELKTLTEERFNIVNDDLTQTKQDFESTKEKYEQLELALEEKNKVIDEDKMKRNEIQLEIQRFDGEIKVFREQISAIEQNDMHFHERITEIQMSLSDKENEMQKYFEAKWQVDEKLDSLDDNQSEAAENLEEIQKRILLYNQEIEECKSEIMQYLNDNGTIKSNMQHYKTMEEQNLIKKAEISRRILKNKSDETFLISNVKDSQEKLKQILTHITDKNTVISNIEEEIALDQKEIDVKNIELSKKQQEYITASARLDSLRNLSERYEGYGNSIRRVMEQKSVSPGILGVVADIIQVEKRYETAIETALGGNIQNIVTDTESTAKELIGFLKRNKFGRATFLPLGSISGNRYSNEAVRSEHGFLGLASDLVKAEDKYKNLLNNLLGRTIIVNTIDHALLIARKYNYSFRIVTLDGEQLNKGGSISGGAFRNSSNLLGRRREMDELEKNGEQFIVETKELQEDLNKLRFDRNTLRNKLNQEKEEMQKLYVLQNTAKLNVKQEELKLNELKTLYEELSSELLEVEKQTYDLIISQSGLLDGLNKNNLKNQEKEEQINRLTLKLEEEKTEEKKESEHLLALRLEFSNLEQSNLYALENIARVKSEIEKLTDDEISINSTAANSKLQKEERTNQILRNENLVSRNTEFLEHLESQISGHISDKEQMTSDFKNFFQRREELLARINSLDKELFRVQAQKEKLSEQIDTLVSYMWEEYEITWSLAVKLVDKENYNVAQNKKHVSEFKNKIKELGDVNVNAIEDYRALTERYTFLKTQHDDLVRSETILLSIINELDEEMRKQFSDRFKLITEQFDLVFKELFGGGKGTLELTEDEDVLEAGIRIIAQPPGKKLQNMMQLSGGEKALTAISLLFAIQNLKPSPFCLLDEIEAALDDSNVKRFADYLHKLTDHTQFIIITHRRGTMSAADILYGITMQEKGISTLVSVNLIEDEISS